MDVAALDAEAEAAQRRSAAAKKDPTMDVCMRGDSVVIQYVGATRA